MTRPHIIRADTLDLQDKTSPTAQDHSRQPQHPAPLGSGPPAPHQESTLRKVEDERHQEEGNLQNGTWVDPNALRDGPDSDDERPVVNGVNGDQNMQRDEQAVRLNGGMGGDDGEMHDADADDDDDMDDDDMMDKISSSPSIDDGGYFLPSLPQVWPERRDSLTPTRSPALSLSTYVDSSSPFTTAPIHFPLSVAAARRPYRVPADSMETIHEPSYPSSPISFQFQPSSTEENSPSTDHHRGEYAWRPDAGRTTNHPDPDIDEVSPRTGHLLKVEDRLQNIRQDSQLSLLSELDEEEIKVMLQPVRSPVLELLDDPPGQSGEPDENIAEDDDDDAWVTDSDADSWDEDAENDDDPEDDFFSDNPRFVDSGWGGECLRDLEDIDFEFVYALHTFVATVEGQANATKGDTMVLLDDSNSYWWLVRIVKDSSIGYLPAEHIETPTERLARLNKHRNIDLSATMLGDTSEKPKNPLKKAIRRRNAKTVVFAAQNSYLDASDYDYSSDEDEGDDELFGGADPNQAQTQTDAERPDVAQDDSLKVEPLKLSGANKDANSTAGAEAERDTNPGDMNGERPTSDEIFDRPIDAKLSRNGTLRNTDSFFKDDNAETRKITLTPNLLRDDSSTSTTGSRERGPSLESLEKNGFADKVKDDKKKKEKKSGMLSGLFKRKDKKAKGALDSFDDDNEKQSGEFGRNSPQSEERASTDQAPVSPQRHTSKGKLQKPQRGRDDSPSKNVKGVLKVDETETVAGPTVTSKEPTSNRPPNSQASSTSTMRLVSPEVEDSPAPAPERSIHSPEGRTPSNSSVSKLNPINMLKHQTNDEPRPSKVKKAKQRIQLDDFDSEEDEKNDPFADPTSGPSTSSQAPEHDPTGRLSESPVQVSAADVQQLEKEHVQDKDQAADFHHPPGLTADTSSQETPSPVSTPTPDDSPSTSASSKPTLVVTMPASSSPTSIPPPSRPAPIPTIERETSPPISSESSSLPAWSDASLRTYLDDGNDIRDTLLVINDTTGVVPVGRDHPLMSKLFVEESEDLLRLGGELDGLLTKWLEGKRRKHKALEDR